ncbi:MAG: branched-chain amino acid transport system II carrier protein [Treponema sp.]
MCIVIAIITASGITSGITISFTDNKLKIKSLNKEGLMKREFRDCIIIGFALFAMFFGAGNLIFPPQLGFLTGGKWLVTFIAFAITGIGVPILGILAMGKAGGDIRHFAGKVSPLFADIFGTIIMLGIGPLLALPRTAATTYEIGIVPFSDSINPLVSSIIFFTIVVFFSIKPSRVIDTIGKYLTPMLIAVLAAIVIRGIVFPIGPLENPPDQNFFLKGFLEGYQTMDALAAMLFATIVIKTIKDRGYKGNTSMLKMNIAAGSVAALGLLLVYGGLMYVGASGITVFPKTISRTALLINVCTTLWGHTGKIILALSIALACFTTAIGLTATAGHFFKRLFRDRISYEVIVIIVSLFSCWLANYGVENIIRYSVPLLEILYPVCILLVLMNLLDDYIPHRLFYVGGVTGTLIVSILQAAAAAQDLVNDFLGLFTTQKVSLTWLDTILSFLPLANIGIGWLFPAAVCALIFGWYGKKNIPAAKK